MRGIVIKKGLIGADDGKYFTYEGYENLDVGDEVDFTASDDGKAKEIFLIKKAYYNSENSGFGGGNSENSGSRNSGPNSYNSENSGFKGSNLENSGFGGKLGSTKLFGVIGSVIGLFSAVFYVGWFFALCAFLLLLLALHNASVISGSRTLFITYLKGIIANFIGIGFVWLGIVLGAVLFFAGGGASSILGILVALVGVFLLIYAFLNWIKTYFELSYLSGNNMFKYFAIVYIIGVCSTWLFGLGYIIMGIAFGLQAFGWWQLSSLKRAF